MFFTKKIALLLATILFFSCKLGSKRTSPIREKNPNNPYTSCLLIEKEFVNKGGKIQSYKELYLSCSIDDYFIKLCESTVKYNELVQFVNKGITVDMEIKEGFWDHCDENIAYAQSRTGKYVVIKKIIAKGK